jgi:solute:Na+ symporter, SSS family
VQTVLSVALVGAYAVVLAYVALRARNAKGYEDFSVARRELPLALIFGSLCATYVGPGFSIGFVGRGFHSGFLFLLVGLAYAVQNILVGLLVAPKLRELKGCYTLGDAMGQKYGLRCQILAGIISVGLCVLFSSVMISAGAVVLTDIFGETIGLRKWEAVAIVAGVTTSYTTFGGLRASVITDAYHFALHSFLLPGILLFVLLFHFKGGTEAFFQHAADATADGFQTTAPLVIVSYMILFLLGETLIPPYANLALASRTSNVSRTGFILGGVFSTLWFAVMIGIGVVSRSFVPSMTDEDYVLLTLVRTLLPHIGYAFVIVAMFSVVLSSLDSLLNAGAVVFTQDILRRFTLRQDDKALVAGRYSTVAIAVLASGLSLYVPSVIRGLMFCYSIWAPAILPALIIGLWIKRPRPLAGFLSMIVGTSVGVGASIWFLHVQYGAISKVRAPAIVPALLCSLLAYAIGHYAQRFFGGHDR